jgi:hypothetical protein
MEASPPATAESELRGRLRDRGWAIVRITGVSMLPTLAPGDSVRLEAFERVAVGDVVTFVLGGMLYTHRVAQILGGAVVCQGDNRIGLDSAVMRDDVLGRVTAFADGRAIPTVHPRLSWIGARRLWRVVQRRAAAGCDELGLIGRQLRRHAEGEVGGLSALGEPAAETPALVHIVTPRDVLPSGRVAPLPETQEVLVPAGIYSRLPRQQRLELVRCLPDGPLTVCAFPRSEMGRYALALGKLRGLCRRLGVPVGDDGDAMVSAGAGLRSGYIHYFSRDELVEELELARQRDLAEVATVVTVLGPVFRARLRA